MTGRPSESRDDGADAVALHTLLEGAIVASRALIEANRLEDGIGEWLGAIAVAAGAELAFVGRAGDTRDEALSMLAAWTRGAGLQTDARRLTAPPTADFIDWTIRLQAGESIWAQIDTLQDRRSVDFWRAANCATNLIVPVMRAGTTIAVLLIAWSERRPRDEATVGVIRAAADGVAAAMLRDQASTQARAEREQRTRIEREHLEAEQARSRTLSAANESLRRVAQSLTPDATLSDFLSTVLRESATVCGSSVGGIFLRDERTGAMRLAVSCIAGGSCEAHDLSTETAHVPTVPDDLAARWTSVLMDRQVVRMTRAEAMHTMASPLALNWEHCLKFDYEIDLPLVAGDQLVGVLSQLFPAESAAARFDFLHARALAHMAAVAIHQDRLATAMQQTLLETERRRAERERLSEVLRAHRLLRAATSALAEATDDTQMFSKCLAAIVEQAGADTAWLFRDEKDDGVMRLVGSLRDGRFSPTGEPNDPAHFRQGFDIRGHRSRRALHPDQLIWRSLRDRVKVSAYPPETYAWHMQEGHAANAVQILSVGTRVVGFLGMVFRTATPPTHSQRQHIHSLTQLVALTLELQRQGLAARRHAEQAAILAERTRLAREIHDNIAQAFVAIQMQLKQVAPGDDMAAMRDDLIALASNGLAQARSAVAALRPTELLTNELPVAVERLVQQLTAGAHIDAVVERPSPWTRLPSAVEDHVFRIVQEAVTNVVRHANAHTLRVELSQTADATTVLVSDDGVGFDTARRDGSGYGLESIRQRAALIGGSAAWLSAPGKGTQMLVSWEH